MDTGNLLIDYREMARLSGLAVATLRSYKRFGLFPRPDDVSQPLRPRWKLSTFEAWMANRPGQGHTRDGLPRKRAARATKDAGAEEAAQDT